MKINISEELRKDSGIGRLVFQNLCMALGHDDELREFYEKHEVKGEGCVFDVKLMAGDVELNLMKYVERWQKGIQEDITKRAKELLEERMGDVHSLFYDLEERLKDEINKRLEDWEHDEL